MAKRITGAVQVLVNGLPVLNKAGAVASGVGISGEDNFEVEPVMGDGEFHGYKETPIMSQLEVTVTDRSDQSLSRIAEVGTVPWSSVTFKTRSSTLSGEGKTYKLQNPVCTRNFSITGGEGETPIKFVGDYWIESGHDFGTSISVTGS